MYDFYGRHSKNHFQKMCVSSPATCASLAVVEKVKKSRVCSPTHTKKARSFREKTFQLFESLFTNSDMSHCTSTHDQKCRR